MGDFFSNLTANIALPSWLSVGGQPFWLIVVVAAYALLLPLFWWLYRRWIRKSETRLGHFAPHYLSWRFGAGLPQSEAIVWARRSMRKLGGHPFGGLKVADDVKGRSARLNKSRGIAKRIGYFLPGYGAISLPNGATSLRRGAGSLPPIRPMRDGQLWPLGNSPQPQTSDAAQAALTQTQKLSEICSAGLDRPNASVAIAHNGRLVFERYPQGLSQATAQPAPELTPVITGALLAVLAQNRRLFLNQAVPTDFWSTKENARETLRFVDLLSSHSGLERWEQKAITTLRNDAKQDVWEALAALEQRAAPAQNHQPNGINSWVLAWLYALCFGESKSSYLAFPRRGLFDEIGMSSTILGHSHDGVLDGYGGLMTSARDLVRFGLLIEGDGSFQGKRILDGDYLALLRDGDQPSPGFWARDFGLGRPEGLDAAGPLLVARSGDDLDIAPKRSGTCLAVFPLDRIVIAILDHESVGARDDRVQRFATGVWRSLNGIAHAD